MKATPILAASLMLPLLASAEDVVVTAGRYSQPVTDTLAAVTVLTKEDIERFGDQDLASLLDRVAGISQVTTGSLGSTSSLLIRGAATGQMIVLIDGVRAGSATTGSATLNAIPLSSIERIEVVRGPVSSLYGADGVGGIIQVFTRDQAAADSDVFVAAEAGSYRFRKVRTGFSVTSGRNQASGAISYTTTDGFDSTTLTSNGNDDADGFTQWSGSFNASSQLTDEVKLGLAHLQSSSDAEFDESCSGTCDPHTRTDIMNTRLNLDYQAAGDWILAGQVGRFVDDSRTDSSFPGEFRTERLSYNLTADRGWGANVRAILGTDGQTEQVESTTDYDQTERSNLGVFGQTNLELDAYSVQGSLRVDDNSAYGTNLTGSVAATAFVTGNLETIASYGTAFRAPSFNELYFPGYGNPDLDPEESATLELALRQYLDQGQWRLSAYRTEVTNLIGTDPNTFTAANIDQATLQGLELEWRHAVGANDIQFNAGYLDARDGDGERLENRPELTASAAYGRQFGPARVDIDVKAESGRIAGGKDLDGFALLGLGGRYSLGGSSYVSARVDNLLDQDYAVNYDAFNNFHYNTAGRTFRLGVEYHL